MKARRSSRTLCCVALGLLAGGVAGAPVHLDCVADSAACPEVVIEGNPMHELPGFGPAPFRGYGDPSVRADPLTGKLWLSYSYLTTRVAPEPTTEVSVHLASSKDGGASWRFERKLAPARPMLNRQFPFQAGVSTHEVSTIAPSSEGFSRWWGMHFRYFKPFGGDRLSTSHQLVLSRAARPTGLRGGAQQTLEGPLTASAWQSDVDLSSLDPRVAACDTWTEPSLFQQDGTLYLVAQCLVLDGPFLTRRPGREFIGVFASTGLGPVAGVDWRWVGRLTTHADARELGAPVLTQPEVTTSRDGGLRLIVTPKLLNREPKHQGCRALVLESLDPPRLARDSSGRLEVTADIRSSDSNGLGPGLCSYDPESSTGILFVRTEIDPETPDIVFRLHETGVHP